MMRNLRFGLLGLVGSVGLAVGCNSDGGGGPEQRPIDSLEATAAINQHIDELLRGLADTSAQTDTTGGTAVATGSINSATGSSTSNSAGDIPKSTTDALDKVLRQVAQEAKDHVFREEFVETKDANQVIYKIDAASACGTSTECLEKLTANPVRFAVTANTDDSLNVALLVGQDRHSPGSALISSKRLAVRADLAEILDVMRLLTDAANQQDFPSKFDGVLEFSIDKIAENEFALSFAVIEKVEVVVGENKGKRVSVTVQPSNPTMQLTINSATNTLGYALNYGAVDVQIAGTAVCGTGSSCGDKERNGTFSGHVGGMSMGFTVSKGAQELTFTNVGMGSDTSYIALNNDKLGTLDVNAKNGRKLSVNFKKTAEGTLVTFDPALDIKVAMMLNKLSDSMKVDMPTWLNDEVFEVMLGGAAKPQVLVIPSSASSDSQLKVQTGTLTLSEKSLATPVEVAAGMCLGTVETSSGTDAPPFSLFTPVVCQ